MVAGVETRATLFERDRFRVVTGARIEDMYQIMAIANYEDRFVIPTVHRELGEDAYDLRGSCGFTFGNGCSDGRTETSLFGSPKKKARTPMEVA